MPDRMVCLRALMVCVLLLSPVFSAQSRATTITQLAFADVLDTAELVFEGRVVHVEAQQTGPRSIHTIVRFEVLDVLKGEYDNLELELRYLGGQVGTRQMTVDSMQIPQLGEHGFYFVESLQTPMVHPLVGWSQGHFLIQTDDTNEERIYTAAQEAVSAISVNPAPPAANAPAILGHDGSSRGVVIQNLLIPQPAMTSERFRQVVREGLGAQGALP
ncbi:MAG: hypothetical protein KKD00_11195 [Gammaproteobacteria bacterium]|nr:hypothetical protein [Gammaproteobacteria bacterium]